ncbi:LEA type 2 family protein [Pseudomonas sp. PDM16]|uniref:LEA type 2 family protein n=1 Tax=Pseudomonas sp. PDM16 TaxID=2769292 RepID=UPI00177D4D77|nr:LEA type 2 family protein [Pseudomonas sp. PDM16]MBD9416444.1 LEA type 2 family protein [Pseudomonas sp. PDM16]
MFSQARNSIIALTIFIGLQAGLTGCTSWFSGDFQDPEVHLVKVDVIKAKLLEQQFSLRFRVVNPNGFELPIRGLSYDIELNGIPLTEGESSEWINVPAHGRREFEVPVRTNLWRHLKGVVKALEDTDKPISYRLRGKVKTGVLFGRNVHLQRNGEIIPSDYIPE